MEKRPIVQHQSGKKAYQNCKRLWAWNRLENLEPVGRRSAPDIGTATHRALAVFHGGGVRPPVRSTTQTDDEFRAEVAFYDRVKDLPLTDQALEVAKRAVSGFAVSWEDKSEGEAFEILDRLLPGYFAYWGERGELWTPLGQEITFCVEVGEGTGNYLRGKADSLSTYKDGLYLVDYKTAGRLDPRDLLKYELDDQLSAYIYGLSKHLTAESIARGGEAVVIRGAIVDVLVKTKIPQYAREFFSRTWEELLEFEAEFNEHCNELRTNVDRVREDGEDWKTVFLKSTEHCFRYGTCPYRDVCLKDTPVRRRLYNVRQPDYVDEARERLEREWRDRGQ